MNIVVVESPAKAKTINRYLGSGYEVLASFGHVRDLPAKDGSVDPEHNFRMIWEVDDKSQKRLNGIARALKRRGRGGGGYTPHPQGGRPPPPPTPPKSAVGPLAPAPPPPRPPNPGG